jgi:hypothetical protein
MRTLLVISTLFLVARLTAQEPRENRREHVLDDGTKIVSISHRSDLWAESYYYKSDGTFEKHVVQHAHPGGHIASRLSYDQHGVLLAFLHFTYDREWKTRAVRYFNSTGRVVLYVLYERSPDNEESIPKLYTSDAVDRKTVQLGSPEHVRIIVENHLQPFQ